MRLSCVAVLGASVLAASGARGQSRSLAQTQYDWGLAEMQAGRYGSGCPALAESYKLDPLPGALFTLAECETKQGRLATALAHYAAYLDAFSRMTAKQKADQVGRDQLAATQRERLEHDVPRLTIKLAPSAPRDTAVQCDGEPVGSPSLDMPLPMDPGEHVIKAESPDGRRFEERFTLAKGERQTHSVDPKPVAPVAPPTTPPAAAVASNIAPEPTRPSTATPSRTWVYSAAAVGIAGVAVGAIGGVLTIANKSTIDGHCGLGGVPTACDSTGKSAADAAKATGLVSDIGFGVGAAGIAAAVVLWATRTRTASSASSVTPVITGGASHTILAGIRTAW